MGLLFIAGIGKLQDIHEFERMLRGWWLVPSWLERVAIAVIPGIEVVLPLMTVLNVGRRWAIMGCAILLALYTAVYGVHLAIAEPPECDCIALLAAYMQEMDRGRALIVRNAILILMLMPALRQAHSHSGRNAEA